MPCWGALSFLEHVPTFLRIRSHLFATWDPVGTKEIFPDLVIMDPLCGYGCFCSGQRCGSVCSWAVCSWGHAFAWSQSALRHSCSMLLPWWLPFGTICRPLPHFLWGTPVQTHLFLVCWIPWMWIRQWSILWLQVVCWTWETFHSSCVGWVFFWRGFCLVSACWLCCLSPLCVCTWWSRLLSNLACHQVGLSFAQSLLHDIFGAELDGAMVTVSDPPSSDLFTWGISTYRCSIKLRGSLPSVPNWACSPWKCIEGYSRWRYLGLRHWGAVLWRLWREGATLNEFPIFLIGLLLMFAEGNLCN